MFLIPLGLGFRLPVFPWMCVVLALGISYYSVSQFDGIDSLEQKTGAHLVEHGLTPTVLFYYDLCVYRLNSVPHCLEASSEVIKVIARKGPAGNEIETARKEQLLNALLQIRAEPQSESEGRSIASEVAIGKDLIKINEEFGAMIQDPNTVRDPEVKALPTYTDFASYHNQVRETIERTAQEWGLLTKRNLSFFTLVRAQFLHNGWGHLISNILVFLLLGIYLEARIGSLGLMTVFFATGMLGLAGHMLFWSGDGQMLMGASAGVAGVMGAFLAFFFNQPMKVWLSYLLVFNRIIYIPAFWILGTLFILHDLSGAIDQSGTVAHGAHLSGLIAGLLFGLAHKKIWRLPGGRLYPDEDHLTNSLARVADSSQRISISGKILDWNPNNLTALKASILTSLARTDCNVDIIGRRLTSYLAITRRSGMESDGLQVLREVPIQWSLAPLIERLNTKNRLKLAQRALKENDWLTAVRLYDSLLHVSSSDAALRTNIATNVREMFIYLVDQGQSLESLQTLPLHADLKAVIPSPGGPPSAPL